MPYAIIGYTNTSQLGAAMATNKTSNCLSQKMQLKNVTFKTLKLNTDIKRQLLRRPLAGSQLK